MIRAAAASIVFSLIFALGAWKVGGGADKATPPPRPDQVTTTTSVVKAGAPAGDGYEAAIRLVEIAKEGRFDLPQEVAAKSVLKAHWRQQRPPFLSNLGENARFVANIGLRMNASETQWAMALEKGPAWKPDAKLWNMNEGSFDQRESLIAPPPGSISFRINVPTGAKLTFSQGTINATELGTAFIVTVIDARNAQHEVYRHVLPPSAARRWTDANADLSAYAGQDVELRLTTESAKATADADPSRGAAEAVPESAYSGPGNGRPTVDGGVVREDTLATPGSTPVALWGNPTILARTTAKVPYNVLWVVIDALRPDVMPSFHDDAEDAKKLAAPWPPLEAILPKVPGLMPSIDDLAGRGVRFTHAYSAGSWTRPGTLAMLAGARSSELGMDTTNWMLGPNEMQRFYGSDPPLLSLMLRNRGVTTRAFVNNYFMVGYAPIGIDMAFERVADHRYRTRDTLEITQDATQWIKDNKDTRFFAFVNYNSPHEPYEPPAKHLERVNPGPKDRIAKLYMAEAAKDDDAVGQLMKTLDEAGLREKTIVIVTSDHGETMSSAHVGTSGLDKTPIRYHHSVSNFEETTKVPIVIALPNVLPKNQEVKARVRSTDIAPTVLELMGIESHPRMSGRSMVALARGENEAEERVVVSEGRGSRAIMHGRYRFLVREGLGKIVIDPDQKTRETDHELYDLQDDPGERHDIAKKKPEVVAEMKARLEAALKNVAVAGSRAPTPLAPLDAKPPMLRLRFAGGPEARRVSGSILVGDAKSKPKSVDVQPVDLGRESFHVDGTKIDVALRTNPQLPVGFDIQVDPPGTPVSWELWLDDKPWPEEGIFGGPFGLLAKSLRKGVTTDEARLAAHATILPTIDARRDVGLFVVRERKGESEGPREADEGAEEMARLLKEWGYAHGSGKN